MEAGREEWGISLQFSNCSAEFESSLGGSFPRIVLVITKIIFFSLHILNCGRILFISALPLSPAMNFTLQQCTCFQVQLRAVSK